jgi:hypothetical protein
VRKAKGQMVVGAHQTSGIESAAGVSRYKVPELTMLPQAEQTQRGNIWITVVIRSEENEENWHPSDGVTRCCQREGHTLAQSRASVNRREEWCRIEEAGRHSIPR